MAQVQCPTLDPNGSSSDGLANLHPKAANANGATSADTPVLSAFKGSTVGHCPAFQGANFSLFTRCKAPTTDATFKDAFSSSITSAATAASNATQTVVAFAKQASLNPSKGAPSDLTPVPTSSTSASHSTMKLDLQQDSPSVASFNGLDLGPFARLSKSLPILFTIKPFRDTELAPSPSSPAFLPGKFIAGHLSQWNLLVLFAPDSQTSLLKGSTGRGKHQCFLDPPAAPPWCSCPALSKCLMDQQALPSSISTAIADSSTPTACFSLNHSSSAEHLITDWKNRPNHQKSHNSLSRLAHSLQASQQQLHLRPSSSSSHHSQPQAFHGLAPCALLLTSLFVWHMFHSTKSCMNSQHSAVARECDDNLVINLRMVGLWCGCPMTFESTLNEWIPSMTQLMVPMHIHLLLLFT